MLRDARRARRSELGERVATVAGGLRVRLSLGALWIAHHPFADN